MILQTQIPLSPKEPQIDYNSKIVLLGSCFTENIGEKLEYFKFQNTQNPFGIIFNPVSISNVVQRALKEEFFSEKDIFQHHGLWHSFEVHSSLSSIDKTTFLEQLNFRLTECKKQLLEASHVIITLGSAWVYRSEERGEIVANCHKVPQREFTKELLSINIIEESLVKITSIIQDINPEVTFIFTVSPVRHIKDGFEENSLSKAHLLSAVHKTIKMSLRAQSRSLHYFPSYEIMMDELRDYRFYKEDMLHPNETAIQYIWEKFTKVWISKEAASLQKEIASIQKRLTHQPFNSESEEYKKFKRDLELKILKITSQLPYIKF